MRFEQIPNNPTEPSKEQPPYPGWVLENGIWRKRTEEEDAESTEDKEDKNIEEEETDKKLRSLEEELKELDSKEYINSDDIKRKEKLEMEYAELGRQAKEPEEKKPEENKKPSAAAYSAEAAASAAKAGKAMEGKEEGPKEKKGEKEKEKENLEKEITANFYDELKKIQSMSKGKTKRYFQLIESWQDLAYLDDYKGIQNIFSELDRLKPKKVFFYNLKKTQTVDKVGLTMALNYKEWELEDKEKLKIIKNFVNKQSKEKNIFYSKDEILKEIAQILASENIPYKNNIDVIVKEIKNPNIKSETIARMADIEKESIEKKKQSLQNLKEDMKRDKLPPDKITTELLEKFGLDKEAVSKVLPELVKLFEDPKTKEKVQKLINTKEFQAFRKTIEKVTKEKGEIPEAVAKAKEHIKKKESGWGTALGITGWIISSLLSLALLVVVLGVDYFTGLAGGKKKKLDKK